MFAPNMQRNVDMISAIANPSVARMPAKRYLRNRLKCPSVSQLHHATCGELTSNIVVRHRLHFEFKENTCKDWRRAARPSKWASTTQSNEQDSPEIDSKSQTLSRRPTDMLNHRAWKKFRSMFFHICASSSSAIFVCLPSRP